MFSREQRLLQIFLQGALLFAIFVGISACSPPSDQSQARLRVIQNDLARTWDDPPSTPKQAAQNDRQLASMPSGLSISTGGISFSPQTLIHTIQTAPGPKTHIIYGLPLLSATSSSSVNGKACLGDAGSILPPLTFSDCISAAAVEPIVELNRVYDFLNTFELNSLGGKNPGTSVNGHVALNGIEQFRVDQSVRNDCWAATIETSRRFLGLPDVPQDQILKLAHNSCRQLNDQDQPFGATTYQIVYAIGQLESTYDGSNRAEPYFCTSAECIIASLSKQRPVIMLNGDHAVLITEVDYHSGSANGHTVILPTAFHLLDPDPNSQKYYTASLFGICRADAFISY